MKTTNPAPVLNLKSLSLIQSAVLVALTGLTLYLFSVQQAASFATGGFIMMANSLLLVWIWSRLLAKKSFALTMTIIVVKYSVLLGAIFFLTREAWFHVLGAGLGMAAFILSTMIQVGIAKWE